jgi:hypothetical protein
MTTVCKRAVFLLCRRVLAPASERAGSPMPDRQHDVSQLTAGVLERTRRDLRISLTLIAPGSPARVPILAHPSAIDAELAERAVGD